MAKKTVKPSKPAKAAAPATAAQFAPVQTGRRNITIDVRFMADFLVQLLRTPSPTGYTAKALHLVRETLAPRFQNVWLVGGAQLCQSFLKLGLVDEIRLSIAPVLLGDGLSLFGTAGGETRWRLKDVVPYKTGFVELVYRSERGSR